MDATNPNGYLNLKNPFIVFDNRPAIWYVTNDGFLRICSLYNGEMLDSCAASLYKPSERPDMSLVPLGRRHLMHSLMNIHGTTVGQNIMAPYFDDQDWPSAGWYFSREYDEYFLWMPQKTLPHYSMRFLQRSGDGTNIVRFGRYDVTSRYWPFCNAQVETTDIGSYYLDLSTMLKKANSLYPHGGCIEHN